MSLPLRRNTMTNYGVNALPESDWREFVKTAPTRMCRVAGPCTIFTLEGPLDMPDGWEGWLAVDSKGHPYPIDAEVQAETYGPVSPHLSDLFDDAQLDILDDVRQKMVDNERQTGSYTTKVDARQTGCSIHYKFTKRTDVLGGTTLFAAITEEAPGKLFWLIDKILEAAGRPLPEDPK